MQVIGQLSVMQQLALMSMQRIDILERWRSGVHTNHLETKTGISLYMESDACHLKNTSRHNEDPTLAAVPWGRVRITRLPSALVPRAKDCDKKTWSAEVDLIDK